MDDLRGAGRGIGRAAAIIAALVLLCGSGGAAAADVSALSTVGTPAIDGILSSGEWDFGHSVAFDHGVVTFRNDRIRLYVLVDVLGDTNEDPPIRFAGDSIDVSFDRDENGAISDFDTNYRLFDDLYNLRYQHYVRPFLFAPREPLTRSSIAAGFDCFVADGTRRLGGTVCQAHRVWEAAFDLDEIFAQPGGTVRLGIKVESENPPIDEYVPTNNFFGDFGDLLAVVLEDFADDLPVTDPGVSIDFDEALAPAIEVTQAVQDRDNGLPLVAGKDTVARAYVTAGRANRLLVAYLYGGRGDADLPGSPLAQLHFAPTVVDRELLTHTANFLLPRAWTDGAIVLQGRALNYDTYSTEAVSSPVPVTFTPKEEPVYWIVSINGGTEEAPLLGDLADLTAQQEHLRATYPVPGVRFRTLPWTVLGAFDSLDFSRYKRPLEDLWLSAFLGAALSGRWDLFPDQIYGFAAQCDSAGGGRCGVAYTTEGIVALGAHKGCKYARNGIDVVACDHAVLSHEINHNLDRGDPRTWGLHVTDPATDPDAGIENDDWGCGAEAPDLAWAARWTDDHVREVGFDTRRPWEDGRLLVAPDRYNLFTVVPPEFPDFMSYCEASVRSGDPMVPNVSANPTRWISAYRWLRLFCNFPSPPGMTEPLICSSLQLGQPPPLVQRLRLGLEQTRPVYYVGGHVSRKGSSITGELRPVFAQPGAPDDDLPPGEYGIELRDGNGATLLTRSFAAPFVDSEGVERDVVEFQLQLPAVADTAEVVLRRGQASLDTLRASAHAPEVSVVQPSAGAQWAAGVRHTIEWSASDQDGDALAFSILYTPDDGRSWHPVAWDIQGGALEIDTAALPGGQDARIRVIATDGFRTSEADSDVFWMEGNAPEARIVRPADGARFVEGEPIDFEAQGFDPEDGFLADEAFVWAANGRVLDVGRRISAHLSPGRYRITLRATDGEGKTARDAIALAVSKDADGDRIADSTDNCPDTPNPDQNDGDVDSVGDACDRCSGTVIPEGVPTKKLLPNHFALVDDDTVFDTVGPNARFSSGRYTVMDTHGCSCDQIIARFHLGIGERKFGCSIGTMQRATR